MKKKTSQTYGDAIARARKARERLGIEDPVCAVCGEDRPVLLERHHVAGRKNDSATVILCKNHHALITDAQKDLPPPTGDKPICLERIGQMLLGLAELFKILIEKLSEFGHYLIDLARSQADGGTT